MTRPILSLILIIVFLFSVSAQSPDDQINMSSFGEELLVELVKNRIDQYRVSNGADVLLQNEVLTAAAIEQASENMKNLRVERNDDIGKRVEKAGGTTNASFLAAYVTAGKSREMYTYSEVADQILEKFTKSKRYESTLTDPVYLYCGIGVAPLEERRRIYVSIVFGGVDVLNTGASKDLRKSLPIKYSKKKMGLKPGDDRTCKGVTKFTDYRNLYDGLEIIENEVYLKYDNLKGLKRLLRRDKDALAVDIIQREQYSCSSDNIMDNTLPSKGIMSKPLYSAKLMKKNEVEGRRVREFYGPIAKLKKKVAYNLPQDYELNLVIIQDKSVCKVVTRGYLENGGQESLTLFALYPDTTINDVLGNWQLKPEKGELTFIVPFEQGKSNYKPEDIQPILDTLNEPKYVIDEIFIEAYSSLEGTEEINNKLQMARAESMIRAIEQIQGSTTDLLKKENILTSDAWPVFQDQIKEDENYAYFVGLEREQVLEEMYNSKEVYKKLEPLLEKQRFAKVKMNVTYDISGEFEEPFVLSRLLKAIKKNEGAEALKIQKFAMRKVKGDQYSADNLIQMEIPKEEQFASLMVNKIYLDNKKNYDGKISASLVDKFKGVMDIAPQNDFATFNYYLTAVKHADIKNVTHLNEIQSGIQELYASRIPKKLVDGINLEYQFRTIEYIDSLNSEEHNEIAENSMERIKKIFKIDGSTWQNALKLGYIFLEANDLTYAIKIMTPFIGKEGVSEEFYYTYISAAAQKEDALYTKEFRIALDKAKEMNKNRFCQLFGEPYLSYQILDHPIIKNDYCKTCN